MANRVLLGNRSGVQGLWVSKPGTNVLTTSDANMLLATDRPMLQVIQSGQYSDDIAGLPAITRTVSIPNQGFQPFLLVTDDRVSLTPAVYWEYLSNTSIRFTLMTTANPFTLNWQYAVLNVPRA